MKKLFLILIIIVYGSATFGMSVKEFYCCGKLKSVSVSFNIFSKSKKDDGCCKTKYHLSKVKDNHIASAKVEFNAKKIVAALTGFNALNIVALVKPTIVLSDEIHGPPILCDNVPIYILHCNYRI